MAQREKQTKTKTLRPMKRIQKDRMQKIKWSIQFGHKHKVCVAIHKLKTHIFKHSFIRAEWWKTNRGLLSDMRFPSNGARQEYGIRLECLSIRCFFN